MVRLINANPKLKNIYNTIKACTRTVILSLTGDPVINKKSNLSKEPIKIWIPSQAEDDKEVTIRFYLPVFNFGFVFFIIYVLLFCNAIQASIFSDYRAKKAYLNSEFKKTIQILEKEQVEKPNDPIVNYNLGTAYYKLDNFEQAKQNLHRCVSNCAEEQNDIKEKAYFNWANSLYKSGLKLLGNNWEKEQVDNEVLDLVITEIKSSVEKYGNVLVLNKDNDWASSNKKKAEEFLKKLEKKQQDKKEQNKDDKESDKQKGDNKKKSESDFNDKQNSSQENNKDGQSQESEQKDKRENCSQDAKKNRDKGENKELDANKDSGKDQDMNKREQGSSSQQNDSGQDGKQKQDSTAEDKDLEDKDQEIDSNNKKETNGKQNGAPQDGEVEKNDIKSKMFRAILDDLQNDEAELQKAMIRYKSKGANPKLNQGQKPW